MSYVSKKPVPISIVQQIFVKFLTKEKVKHVESLVWFCTRSVKKVPRYILKCENSEHCHSQIYRMCLLISWHTTCKVSLSCDNYEGGFKINFTLFVVSHLITLAIWNLACLFPHLVAVSDKNFVAIKVLEHELQMLYHEMSTLNSPSFSANSGNCEIRTIIKFLTSQNKMQMKFMSDYVLWMANRTLGWNKCIAWMEQFKSDWTNMHKEERIGWPSDAVNDEMISIVRTLLQMNFLSHWFQFTSQDCAEGLLHISLTSICLYLHQRTGNAGERLVRAAHVEIWSSKSANGYCFNFLQFL